MYVRISIKIYVLADSKARTFFEASGSLERLVSIISGTGDTLSRAAANA